jgi:hypothetical protein
MEYDELFIEPLDVVDEDHLPLEDLLDGEITPPYFITRNIVFAKELEYFLSPSQTQSLPVFFTDGVVFDLIGHMVPTLDYIFRAKFLDTKISYVDKDNEELDLNVPTNLIKFIMLPDDTLERFGG